MQSKRWSIDMKLYGFWRSSAAYRVRIALKLKGIDVDHEYVNLIDGDQRSEAFGHINPQHLIPTLVDGDHTLSQSLAIIEYLEETRPQPALLTEDAAARARPRDCAGGCLRDPSA